MGDEFCQRDDGYFAVFGFADQGEVQEYARLLMAEFGDAHGTGRRAVKPKPRHAELAVNLAGTMASFLVATWKEKGGR